MIATRPQPPPLVGRETVLDALWSRVEQSVEHGLRVVVLRGPAGVGKSRLLEAFAERARSSGAAVISGRAPVVGGFAFGALSDALAAFVRSSASAGGQIRRAGEPLRRLVPALGLGDDDSGADTPDVLPVVQAAYRLVRSITERRPLAFVVDDAHLADAQSCEVLWTLQRQAPELAWTLVFSMRHPAEHVEPGARRLIDELRREHEDVDVELGPLDRSAVATLMASLLGDGLPAPAFVDMIVQRTAGNPYYVEEMVRWLRATDRLRRQGLQWSIVPGSERELPPSIEEALDTRISGLDAAAHEALEVISAAGGAADASLLAQVNSTDGHALAEATERLAAAQLITPSARSEEMRVHHPLIAECTYRSLAPARRRSLHRALALAFAARDAPAAVVATHFMESAEPGDPDAVAAAMRAADDAEAQYQYGRALGWYRQVLALQAGDVNSPMRTRALDRISELAATTGQLQEGLSAVQELLQRTAAHNLLRRVTLLRRMAALRNASGDREGARAALDEGLTMTGQSSPETVWLFFGLARIALQTLPMHEFRDIVQRGMAAALEAGPAAQPAAIMLRSFAACSVAYGGDPARGRELAYEAGKAAEELGDPVALGYCVYTRNLCNQLLGRCEEAANAFEAIAAPAEDVGLVWEGASAWAERGEALFYAGDLEGALESCMRGEDFARRHDAAGSIPQPLITAALICVHRLDPAGARERLGEARRLLDRRPDNVADSWYWYVHGQLGEALDDAAQAASSYERAWQTASGYGLDALVVLRPAHVRALQASGRADVALQVAEDVQAMLDGREQPRAHAFAQLALAAALAGSGDSVAVREHVRDGLALADTLEGRYFPALARLLAGEVLVRAGDRRAASDLLSEARDRFATCGYAWLHERAASQLRRIGVRVAAVERTESQAARAPDPLAALTRREREVASLVAGGATSRATALRLGLSERTVENHLGNVYLKLRLHNRAELIALIARTEEAGSRQRTG